MVNEQIKSIYLVVASPEIGGTELQLTKLARELQCRGKITKVIILKSRGPLNTILDRYKIDTENFDLFSLNPIILILNFFRYFRLIKNEKPNVLYSFLPHAIIASAIALTLSNEKTLLIAGIRGTARTRHPIIESVFNSSLKKTDLVICNTKLLAKEIQDRLITNKNKSQIIYNGVYIPDKIANCFKVPPLGIVVANFLPEKGYENLLEILAQVNNDCKYIFCGNGSDGQINSIRAMINRLNLHNTVDLKLNPFNIEELMLSSQFAIHPSLNEGLSNAILEEMACGLPVIAFDVGGNSELVVEGLNGFLIPKYNNKRFGEAIYKLSSDTELRASFGNNSRKIAQKFSFEISVTNHLDLFERTFNQKFCKN